MVPFETSPERITQQLQWFKSNWTISFYPVFVYVAFLVIGLRYMREQPPFKLNNPLGFWSLGLTILSFFGSVHCVSAVVTNITKHGIVESFCRYRGDVTTSLWVIIFAWSKIPELIDTVFIVLRKQKLIFLHYYHHLLTVIYCFHALSFGLTGIFLWVSALNYTVHVGMYAYYTIRAFKICRVPSFVNRFITISQIVQMITAVLLYSFAWVFHQSKWKSCDTPLSAVYMGLFVTITYLILFLNFFKKTYLSPVIVTKKDS